MSCSPGAIPLVTGVILVAIYARSYAFWVPTAELILLVCAPGFLVAGGACLSLANAPRRRPAEGAALEVFHSRFWRRLVLLLVNIPAAIAGGFIINSLENDTVVAVINESGTAIEECVVVAVDGMDRKTEIHANIPAGSVVRSEFTLDEEGTVNLTLRQRDVKLDVEVIANMHPAGIKQRVRVLKGLKYRIEAWE